jgi:hypothetical protein
MPRSVRHQVPHRSADSRGSGAPLEPGSQQSLPGPPMCCRGVRTAGKWLAHVLLAHQTECQRPPIGRVRTGPSAKDHALSSQVSLVGAVSERHLACAATGSRSARARRIEGWCGDLPPTPLPSVLVAPGPVRREWGHDVVETSGVLRDRRSGRERGYGPGHGGFARSGCDGRRGTSADELSEPRC